MKTISEDNYVDKAEGVMKSLSEKTDKRGRRISMVTTSQIRNLLAMTADIYNEAAMSQKDSLSEEVRRRIEYLRVRVIYECGRTPKVNDFIMQSKVLDVLKEINGSKKNYILFSHYMEALVAFHKYYGGAEN